MRRVRVLQTILAALMILIVAAPAIEGVYPTIVERKLVGWVPPENPSPAFTVQSFINGDIQRWLSERVSTHIGFRASLIRTSNEITYRLSGEIPQIGAVVPGGSGIFIEDHVLQMDWLYRHQAEYNQMFSDQAKKLREIQDRLAAQGKYFVVVLAVSKPAIYLDKVPHRFLARGLTSEFGTDGDLAKALAAAGVNYIDGRDELWRLRLSGIPTHPASGIHWNYFSGCVIASKILDKARGHAVNAIPRISCGAPLFGKPYETDNDVLDLMNLWSKEGLDEETPRPQISLIGAPAQMPNILFIGDSYVGQVAQALTKAKAHRSLVYVGYMASRYSVDVNTGSLISQEDNRVPKSKIEAETLGDVSQADIVVLEQVDYNRPVLGTTYRPWFGFTDLMQAHGY